MMTPIKTREEALKVMEDFREYPINGSGEFSAAMDALLPSPRGSAAKAAPRILSGRLPTLAATCM